MPHYDARASGGPHLAAADADRVMKRSLDDPYTSSAKAHKQDHDIQMAASTTAGSASKSSDKEQLIRKFVEEFQRRPRMRSTSMEERSLAKYIKHNSSKLHSETKTMLNDLNDPAACAARSFDALGKTHLLAS